MLCVSVSFERDASIDGVADSLAGYEVPVHVAGLPGAGHRFIEVLSDEASPQPRKHVDRGGGMTVTVGRIQKCPVNDVKYVALVHNTVRGAAGGAILNAELLVAEGYLGLRDLEATEKKSVR
jgi:aspartate-semialdehyde dehydrogenase